jgi:hypothetical protein
VARASDDPERRRLDATALAARVDRAEAGDAAAGRGLWRVITDWSELAQPLRFRLERGQLAYVLEHAADFPDDAARELYSELVERYRGDAAPMAELRTLGRRLQALEDAGALPRVMVVRSRRRRDRA